MLETGNNGRKKEAERAKGCVGWIIEGTALQPPAGAESLTGNPGGMEGLLTPPPPN